MADTVPQDIEDLAERRTEFVRGFAAQVKTCVARRDTSHPLFNGCIDWHSSVHGHWALAAAARLTDRDDLKAFLLARLTPERIARERADLAAHPNFEMPYGRAWFLRLVAEFERTFDDPRLRRMGDEMARTLIAFLKREGIEPLSSSYGSHSWALINLAAYGRHTGDDDITGFVEAAVREHFLDTDGPCPADLDQRRRSFMAVCTNWAWLVSQVLDGPQFNEWLEGFLPDPDALKPVRRPANAHVYGLNFSRAWGIWRIYRKSGDERFLKLYRAHLEPTFDRPSWWRGDYRVVGHWVSQFGMLATVPLFEPDGF